MAYVCILGSNLLQITRDLYDKSNPIVESKLSYPKSKNNMYGLIPAIKDITQKYLENIQKTSKIDYIDIPLAPGIPFIIARLVQQMGIEWRAIIPFKSHSAVWPNQLQYKYHLLLKHAADKIYVDRQSGFCWEKPDIYGKGKYHNMMNWLKRQLHIKQTGHILMINIGIESNLILEDWSPFKSFQHVDFDYSVQYQNDSSSSKTTIFINKPNIIYKQT